MPDFLTYKPSIGPGQRDYVTKFAAMMDELDARFNVAATFGGTVAVTGTLTANGAFTANGNVALGDNPLDSLTIAASAVTWSNAPTHSGNHTFSGNVTIGGDLIVNGTTYTVNSTTVTIDDPVFTLGGDTAPSVDDNKDRGIEFRYHNGSAAKVGFFGWDDSLAAFTFIADATNSSEVFSGTAGNVVFGTISGTTGTFTGNVGVGATPIAVQAGYRSAQIGSTHAGIISAGTDVYVNQNASVVGGTWTYGVAGAASYYEQTGATHTWTTAPSGAAGGTIAWTTRMTLSNGLQIGAPTGGDKGAGTINVAADIYKNNSAYTNPDYVLEHWATGRIDKFAERDGAASYRGLAPIGEVEAFARRELHLPRFGQKAGHGIFSGSDAMLAAVEEAYLYLFDHERRMKALEARP